MAARALLSSCSGAPALQWVAIAWGTASGLRAVDNAVRVRDGVDPLRCNVSGSGLTFCQVGDNSVAVAAVDGEGDAVDGIEADDVCVSIEGGGITSVAVVGELGVVEVVYRVPEGSLQVSLTLSVCGAVLRGSPWTIRCPLGGSAILASVAPDRVAAFLRELSVWLPRPVYRLLYRGSRDGMTGAAFHRLCDGKGPTLALLRCDSGWVFGGYTDASWESTPLGKDIRSPAAFLFSVTGPDVTVPTRFPVVRGKAAQALWGRTGCGPVFSGGLYVVASGISSTGCFDGTSSRHNGGNYYPDPIQVAREHTTWARYFVPVELEVFAVTLTYTPVNPS
ncbi:MAG: TLD domain-containing protein [Terracidiphilus sp.]|nr:TLD domain-containing protein [Terracidiphilus sp.]